MKVQLCCGKNIKKGFTNVDLVDYGQEIICDINNGLPFDNGSVEYILIESGIEHLNSPIDFLKNVKKVLKKDGIIEIETDHYKYPKAYMPQHKTLFSRAWFVDELNEDFLGLTFNVVESRLIFTKKSNIFLEFIPNLFPRFWETFFPCVAIRTKLKK